MCCHWASPSWNACHQLGHSPERRPRTRCCIALVKGQEEDWSEDTPGGACFHWREPNGMEEFSKFHISPRCHLSALHAQRGEWGSTTLQSTKGTLDCHSKWVSIEMQDTKTVTILYPYYKTISGGLEWPNKMRQTIRACTHCLQYEVASLRSLYAPLWLLLPWISYMLTLQALRPC